MQSSMLLNWPKQVSGTRWTVLAIVGALFLQSLLFPLAVVFPSRHLYIGSARGGVVLGDREFDISVARVWLPYPVLAGIVLLRPTFGWLLTRRIARRHSAGRCIHCGYDLRPTRGCCPECGRVPEGRKADIIRERE
jgi:hypothetical protein